MNKLYYIANIRIPTEKAHGIQIMEMCNAFADQGQDVILVVPKRNNPIKDNPFKYHDVKENFSIKRLFCLDLMRFGRIGFLFQSLIFSERVAWFAFFHKDSLFFTRDEIVAVFLRAMGIKVIWEAHQGHKNLVIKTLLKFEVPIVTISEGLRELYISMGANRDKVLVAADGADLKRFDLPLSKESARKQLGLPVNKKIILYKGHLYSWKGAGTFGEAAPLIKHADALCVFIGGTEADVISFKEKFGSLKNVLILGNRPRQETPIYQKAADILVIPNSAKEDISRLYTSPMKLFGYMAGDRPIISSDLPSIKEVLDESLAAFFKPDDPASLAETIDLVLEHYEEAEKKSHKTFLIAKNYSWENRAKNILEFFKK